MAKTINLRTDNVERKSGKSYVDETYYKLNSNGIYEKTFRVYDKDENPDRVTTNKKISGARIKEIKKVKYNQFDEPHYIVLVEEAGDEYEFFGNKRKIVSKFKNVLNITTSYKLKDVVSEIFDAAYKNDIVETIKCHLPKGVGIFFNDDHVKSLLLERIIKRKNKDKTRKEKAKEAMQEIENLFNFYFPSNNGRRFANSIYACGLYSVMSFLRKQKGMQTPSVIIEGPTNTGKTALSSLVLYTYGINKNNKYWSRSMMSGSDMRPATIDRLSDTTFPVFFDESQSTLDKISGDNDSEDAKAISEMLKIASDGNSNQPVRSTMDDPNARTYIDHYCTRTMFFISNYSINQFRGDAWKKRILLFESTPDMSKKENKYQKIGSILSDFNFVEQLRDLGEWIVYDLIIGKTDQELDEFLNEDFFESAKKFYNHIRKELGFSEVMYRQQEQIWSGHMRRVEKDIRSFYLQRIDLISKKIRRRIENNSDYDLKEQIKKEKRKRNIILSDENVFKKSLADNIVLVLADEKTYYLLGKKTEPEIIIAKSDFRDEYKTYADYFGANQLENGSFENTFLKIKSAKKVSGDSIRVGGEVIGASTIRMNFYDFLNWLTGDIRYKENKEENKKDDQHKKDKIKKPKGKSLKDRIYYYIKEQDNDEIMKDELYEHFEDEEPEKLDEAINELSEDGTLFEPTLDKIVAM